MHSDDLFPAAKENKGQQWEALEKRINRLLEGIMQLRNANGQLMKENVILKNQLKEAGGSKEGAPAGSTSAEYDKLKKQYDEALQDLRQVKQNLNRLESLAGELKLDDPQGRI